MSPRLATLLQWARRHRRSVAGAGFGGVSVLALALSHWAGASVGIPSPSGAEFAAQLLGLLMARALVGILSGLPRARWSFLSVDDLHRFAAATGLSSALFFLAHALIPQLPGVLLLTVALETTFFLIGSSALVAAYRSYIRRRPRRPTTVPNPAVKRVLVIGSGEAGIMLAKTLNRSSAGLRVVGFLDDDPYKQGTVVAGATVLGTAADAARVLERVEADALVLAIPSATPEQLTGILRKLEGVRIPLTVLPGIESVLSGNLQVDQFRTLKLEDLLGRPPVELETPELAAEIAGRTVLITGAAGSIGSELARQVAANGPGRLVLLDKAESDLYWLQMELQRAHPGLPLVAIVGDCRERWLLEELFAQWLPHRVYHAAAYKHVPLMETNPRGAVRNNVGGTWEVASAAGRHRAAQFLLISTDKAADPASVMGWTKHAAEAVVRHMQELHPATAFTAVRFGNVLGSNGSVIPLFQRQIEAGGPITVTHPKVRRYFMTIPEAVKLVLKTSLLTETQGKIAVLEMGEQVLILELARNLVRLAGKRPGVDIDFQFCGLRPGEKLEESLLGAGEVARPSTLQGVGLIETPAHAELGARLGTVLQRIQSGGVAPEVGWRQLDALVLPAQLRPELPGALALPRLATVSA
jgi:FlaA1/EpsC-like NDP-sugar epimerase